VVPIARPEIVLRAMVEMFSTGDVSAVDDVVAVDYIDHQGLGGNEMHGVVGFVHVVEVARKAYSDMRVEVVDLESHGDSAEGRLHWTGVRHDGSVVERETIEIIRVADGRAVEHWGRRL
jgi:predicted SnoaL-like aldol condensation-catalyzing enzyme